MMTFHLPKIHITPPKNLRLSLEIASHTILPIVTGRAGGERYRKLAEKFWFMAQRGESFVFQPNEGNLAAFALSQEDGLLEKLLESKLLMKALDGILRTNCEVTKPFLKLYYKKFWKLENQEGLLGDIILRKQLKEYKGRNPMVLSARANPSIVKADFPELLLHDKKLHKIKKELFLHETDEFYSQLMLTDYLQQCEKLEIDDDSHTLFAGIRQYKNRKSRIDGRLLGEQAVFILLSRTRHVQGIPSDIWMNFILECVGDPRSFRAEARFAWQRIGTDLKEWLIGILSQGDIKEFLESISDGQGDEVYKYRRQFWMQFIGHVRYAKLMVCNDNLQHIRRNNPLLYDRFKTQPSVYSQMRRQGERRSFIYMDFGEIKVIEGTKSSKVRLYRQEPVSLEKKLYDCEEFYNNQDSDAIMRKDLFEYEGFTDNLGANLIFEQTHTHSDKYAWQNKVLMEMNHHLGTHVMLEDVLLPEDQNWRRGIRNWLLKNHGNIADDME